MNPKKASSIAVLSVLLLTVIPIALFSLRPEPAQARADLVHCYPTNSSVVCKVAGRIILQVPIPTIKVPGPRIEIPGPTIRVPGPTIRIPGPTIRVPGPRVTETVRVPGERRTVYLPGDTETLSVPGPTKTVLVKPDGNPVPPAATKTITSTRTVTAAPGGRVPTPTATVTVRPDAGQTPGSRATVSPSPVQKTKTVTETQTKTETIVEKVFLGTLASMALAGLGILALFLGYLLGQRDSKKNEDKFLEGLLDATKIRKRP